VNNQTPGQRQRQQDQQVDYSQLLSSNNGAQAAQQGGLA